jgi:hypothetical protein
VPCSFHLDVGLYRFANDLHHAIADKWRPSKAFQITAEFERVTIARLLVSKDGSLVSTTVMSSAGIDFLDGGVVAALKPGIRLPQPPKAFMSGPGPATVFVSFLHRAGEVRVRRPQEDIDAE